MAVTEKTLKNIKKPTQEYKLFRSLQLKGPMNSILSAEGLFDVNDRYYPLLEYVYMKTKELYLSLGSRKNGQDPFIHPLNVVFALKRAKVHDPITLAAGILHDYVEERVDIFQETLGIPFTEKGYVRLEEYELSIFEELEGELECLAEKYKFEKKDLQKILQVVHLLTRHKRHYYLKSISYIFNSREKEIKERAIQIKLADRLHNILSIECFSEESRIYQCFKNLFILNNTKQYLLKNFGVDVFEKSNSVERLFNWCSKATYDAFITICKISRGKQIEEVVSLLQLAFKKFMLEKEGIWKITTLDPNETHPMRLYQCLVTKYDARLHQEGEVYEQVQKSEKDYCHRFFANFHFSEEQILAILHYKDAYSLKEVIARLIYQPSFVISGFLASELSDAGRIRLQQKRDLSLAFPNFFKRSAVARL